MDAHVFNVVEVFIFLKGEGGLRHHLAHISCLDSANIVGHPSSGEVAALLAPVGRGIPPGGGGGCRVRENAGDGGRQPQPQKSKTKLQKAKIPFDPIPHLPLKGLLAANVAHAALVK